MDYTKEISALRTNFEELEKRLFLIRKTASVDYQTQIDQIKSNVNACQNSLNSVEESLVNINVVLAGYGTSLDALTGNVSAHTERLESIEGDVADLQQVHDDFESLQTAITTCENSIATFNTKISTLQTSVNIANFNMEYLTTTLETAVFDLALLKANVGTAQGYIVTLQNQMSAAQANITTNTNNLSTLQSSLAPVAFSGDYDDLINKPDIGEGGSGGDGGEGQQEKDKMASEVVTSSTDECYELNEFEVLNEKNEIVQTKIHFICSPEMYIEGNVDVNLFSFQENFSTTVRMYYDDELVFEKIVTVIYVEEIFNFPFRIYPKKNKGYFTITSFLNNYMFIKNSTFHITSAKNFLFLNNYLRWTVTVNKHKYYIGHNKKYPNPYYILDANNFNFSSPQYFPFSQPTWCTFFPKPTYSGGVLTIDENYLYALARDQWDFKFNIYDMNTSTIKLSKYQSYGFSFTYFTEHSTSYNFATVVSVYGDNLKLTYWSGHSTSVFSTNQIYYKVNGVEVEGGCWIANNAVQQIDMTNAPFNVFQGSVAVRDDGMCIFFPHYDTTYTIELGIGRRPTAFRQENGNIHIYIGRQNYVIKFVLVKNPSTNKFEISSQEKIYGVHQYHETLDNKAICLIGDKIKLVNL